MTRFATPTLKARLKGGRPLGLAWCSLGSVAVAEAAWDAGAEAVAIDLQHGLWDRAGLEAAVASQRGPTLARVEAAEFVALGRALDAGCEGVIAPLVETPAEAAAVARACRYPPLGARSGGGVRPLADFAAYRGWAEAVVVGVMIETEAAAARAAEIAATPGLDLVFVGTGDLALDIGPGADAPARVAAALSRILAACRAAGVAAGLYTPDAAAARRRLAEGWQVVTPATDVTLVRAGWAAGLGG
jgi:2-dehydro-3-deoxyglucarate aldolase/4-hydroxy-2-oxoheptanedioate aldolase